MLRNKQKKNPQVDSIKVPREQTPSYGLSRGTLMSPACQFLLRKSSKPVVLIFFDFSFSCKYLTH